MAIAALDAARQARAAARRGAPTKADLKAMKAERRKKRFSSSGRGPRLATLLAAGAAVGAAAAFTLRRRNQPRWDEYDPGQALDAVRSDAKPSGSVEATSSASTSDPSSITVTETTSPTNRG
jgi:hypothetical protein